MSMIQLLSVGRSLSRVNADSNRYTMASSGSIPMLHSQTPSIRENQALGLAKPTRVWDTRQRITGQVEDDTCGKRLQQDVADGFNVR